MQFLADVWKKHWHRCFWRCLKKKKHCINDASNGVNRPPLTGTRLSRLIETWKFTTICLVIYNVYYTSILLFIGSSSAGRSRKLASENLGAFTASGEGPEHRLTIKDCRLWNIFLTSGCLRVSFIASFASLLFSRFGGNLFGKVKVKRQKIMFPRTTGVINRVRISHATSLSNIWYGCGWLDDTVHSVHFCFETNNYDQDKKLI